MEPKTLEDFLYEAYKHGITELRLSIQPSDTHMEIYLDTEKRKGRILTYKVSDDNLYLMDEPGVFEQLE